jgi:HK97 gp10 family phage protein
VISAGVSVDVSMEAIDALIARMERLDAVVAKYGALIRDEAKRLARVDSGEMRDNIRLELEALAATIIGDTDHTAANEYGTARMAAQPMFRPALERYGPAFLAEVAALFGG